MSKKITKAKMLKFVQQQLADRVREHGSRIRTAEGMESIAVFSPNAAAGAAQIRHIAARLDREIRVLNAIYDALGGESA